jgi:hypothetical protein
VQNLLQGQGLSDHFQQETEQETVAANMPDGPCTAPESAAAVLEKLLSPPRVPDASWFAAASAGLVRAAALVPCLVLSAPLRVAVRERALASACFCTTGGCRCECNACVHTQTRSTPLPQVLTRPDQNEECAMLVQCLQSGSFRTQSAVLEFLAACIGHLLSPGEYGDPHAVPALPQIPQALHLLVSDEGRPILSAALALCREQPIATARGKASNAQRAICPVASAPGDPAPACSWGFQKESTSKWEPSVIVPQRCCENPTDCEEPAVRERALRFLACLATRASSPSAAPPARPPSSCSPSAGVSVEEGFHGGGADSESQGPAASAEAHELWGLCTSQSIIKDVLAAFTVNSAMVAAAAGEALGKLLMLHLPPDGWRLCRKFVAQHLKTLGPLLADLSLEACFTPPPASTASGPMAAAPCNKSASPTTTITSSSSSSKSLLVESCRSQGGEVEADACLMSEMMRRVLSLHKEELPRECCLQVSCLMWFVSPNLSVSFCFLPAS